MPPLGWGLLSLALVSLLFEPLRLALWRFGDKIGGVGGVGGLTNQFSCNTTDVSNTTNHMKAPYCFHPGWLGFTSFGGAMLLMCTVPFGLSALAAYRAASLRESDAQETSTHSSMRHGGCVVAFSLLGGCASSLWFLTPLAYYMNAPFYQKDIWHMILAVSIAASYPLSWHLAFVAIPSSGVPFLAPLLGVAPATLKACHVRAAWATLFWGTLHAFGELAYLASQGMLDILWFHSSSDSDSLTFIFGMATLLLLVALVAHAWTRHYESVARSFRRFHRVFASMLLLVAAAHWWSFAIFLAPSIACAATGFALDGSPAANVDQRDGPLALAAATLATLAGIVSIWAARQAWMLAHSSDYYTLHVHMFPPAAVGIAFLLARGAAKAVLLLLATKCRRTRVTRVSREAPLLGALSAAAGAA